MKKEEVVAEAFGFRITVLEGEGGREGERKRKGKENVGAEVLVVVRWLRGWDSVVFESFCGMVKRGLVEDG